MWVRDAPQVASALVDPRTPEHLAELIDAETKQLVPPIIAASLPDSNRLLQTHPVPLRKILQQAQQADTIPLWRKTQRPCPTANRLMPANRFLCYNPATFHPPDRPPETMTADFCFRFSIQSWHAASTRLHNYEIGRASCRERV